MAERVKSRRYQSARRAAQAAQTRRDIVTAAGLLFRERGYGVPLADVAIHWNETKAALSKRTKPRVPQPVPEPVVQRAA